MSSLSSYLWKSPSPLKQPYFLSTPGDPSETRKCELQKNRNWNLSSVVRLFTFTQETPQFPKEHESERASYSPKLAQHCALFQKQQNNSIFNK